MKKVILFNVFFILLSIFCLSVFAQLNDENIKKELISTVNNAGLLEGLQTEAGAKFKYWFYIPILLFVVSFCIGVVAVLGGVGGGVLYVPIVSSFFPIHIDFVRACGLLIALCGSLSSSPALLRSGLVNLRISMPMAFVASISAIFGAMIGMRISPQLVQVFLGVTILFIVLIMLLSKNSDYPEVKEQDFLGKLLKINGVYLEDSSGKEIEWHTHRTIPAIFLFLVIGFLAGMFGLGAGWANVPVLNQVMGAPLKVSVASSIFILSIVDTAAVWVYINKGALLSIVVIPSIIGMMIGAKFGVLLLKKTRPDKIKKIIIALLLFSSIRALLKGTGIWN